MLQTDLFFNEAKSIFIVILLIFILKGDTIMVIIRNGEEIELTQDEVSDAHKEFVTSWMSGVAVDDFSVNKDDAADVAECAYDIYCDEEGCSEYETVEKAVEGYDAQE